MSNKLTDKEAQMNRSASVMARHFEYEIEKIAKSAGFPSDLYRERVASELMTHCLATAARTRKIA